MTEPEPPPLIDAAKKGDAPRVASLLDGGAAIDHRDANDRSALHWAAYAGHAEVVRLLLSRGADLNSREHGYTMLDVTTRIDHVWTPVSLAAAVGRLDVINLLLDAGADPEIGEVASGAALEMAFRYERRDAVKLLIERGAKTTFWNPLDNRGSLSFAAVLGWTDVVEMLLPRGIDERDVPHALRRADDHRDPRMKALLEAHIAARGERQLSKQERKKMWKR